MLALTLRHTARTAARTGARRPHQLQLAAALSTPSEQMEVKLKAELGAVEVAVEDVSVRAPRPRQTKAQARAARARASRPEFARAPQGGCGAMYACYIESPRFAGLNTIKQHKLVQGVLKGEIADMHGSSSRPRCRSSTR
ncbi:iron-sulfur cluster-associated protein [Aureococcus anophagefferens]|uniref:Iron-sulfur cluster-associated protein n=1 Tax=Aureococcus anophagefferens TaxID=44056 RepID=A0ABR1FNN8_AURAN